MPPPSIPALARSCTDRPRCEPQDSGSHARKTFTLPPIIRQICDRAAHDRNLPEIGLRAGGAGLPMDSGDLPSPSLILAEERASTRLGVRCRGASQDASIDTVRFESAQV